MKVLLCRPLTILSGSPKVDVEMAINLSELSIKEFLCDYDLYRRNLMWFLGAGASFSAGVMTAGEMIWRFKHHLYITDIDNLNQEQFTLNHVFDSQTQVRTRNIIQDYIDQKDGLYPRRNDPREYSIYFENLYPTPDFRQKFIIDAILKNHLSGKIVTPSTGHLALAELLHRQAISPFVWTTNFDVLFEDAYTKVTGSSASLTIADLDKPHLASEKIESGEPLLVKLHGDCRSYRIKNTIEELSHPQQELLISLLTASQYNGLVVIGYSGRDPSIMQSLDRVVAKSGAFPFGLFWLHYQPDPLEADVVNLLHTAQQNGIKAYLVNIDGFDSIISQVKAIATKSPRKQFSSIPPGVWSTSDSVSNVSSNYSKHQNRAIRNVGLSLLVFVIIVLFAGLFWPQHIARRSVDRVMTLYEQEQWDAVIEEVNVASLSLSGDGDGNDGDPAMGKLLAYRGLAYSRRGTADDDKLALKDLLRSQQWQASITIGSEPLAEKVATAIFEIRRRTSLTEDEINRILDDAIVTVHITH